MKIWDKGIAVDKKIEQFTVGRDRELDLYLARFDVQASKAQANMLARVGLLAAEENEQLQRGLTELAAQLEDGTFTIDDSFEDVHSKIEYFLTEKFGDAGKKIHTARSRNDQVLTAIQLFLKDYSERAAAKTLQLVTVLLQKAKQHQADLMPGYTHFQAAMPSSFGLWFSAYAEHLLLDLALFEAAHTVADQNPLGSGAGFGSSFPIDRQMTTRELQFGSLAVSSVGAQMLRGKTEKTVAFALAGMAATLAKMAYDLVLYNSQDLAFVELPAAFTTGSSIMPHKKNPDVFELIRARCNALQALPNTLMLATSNLPSGYHRDFQILKEILFEPLTQFLDILDIVLFALPELKIKPNLVEQAKYDAIFTVENINQLIQAGAPFREAYKQVGHAVEDGSYVAHREFHTTHLGSVHNLGLAEIQAKVDAFRSRSRLFR
ncbi:argininosuccinate lyase [Hymenobacter busanensis]|uniref:Argininosuccinate lyase n=1 Tax=Hymenobacter busanensis TaxID=2607656 RepID=A0A7L5A256_9BACT|nr:argininosuccinate lyase [Hymenobacter busanensis]KAA9338469.1 argininosuccinate lyase [Hymenobacter busanensis]QHJ09105.1 argininosuccinate lyase [Hymenobacter busanensis]